MKWSTLDGGCTEFSRVLKPEIEKMGALKKNGPNGDPKSEKGPHGDPGPQIWTHVGAVCFNKQKSWKSKHVLGNSKFISLGCVP